MRIGRPPRATRWLAAAVGIGVAVAVVIIARPAGASTTVNAQLAFSGVVTQTSPTGGSVVGIHPGDSVDFKPATVPTEGLDALGFSLGDILGNVLNLATGYQVVMHLPSTFPGGKRDVKLGACGGKSDLKVAFPTAGTYNFTWSAYSVNLLCLTSPITLDGNAAKDAGIALNASNQWVGKVVAATDPPAGGISVQLPAVSASPEAGGVQLPPVGEPGATLPTITTGGSGSSPTTARTAARRPVPAGRPWPDRPRRATRRRPPASRSTSRRTRRRPARCRCSSRSWRSSLSRLSQPRTRGCTCCGETSPDLFLSPIRGHARPCPRISVLPGPAGNLARFAAPEPGVPSCRGTSAAD